MGFRFIYGRSGSGKSTFCLNEIKTGRLTQEKKNLVLIVPEQFTLQAEKNLIKVLGTGGIMDVQVLSFRRMAYRVLNEVGGMTRKHINTAGKAMLVCHTMESMRDEFKIFSKAVCQQGFVNTIVDMIGEFKRYGVTPKVIDEISKSIPESDILKDKLQEINLLYSKYEEKIKDRYMDADDDLTILADNLTKSSMFDGALIWMDEFTGFTPQELKVIENLGKKAERVNITLCTDCLIDDIHININDVFSPIRNTAERIMRLAGESGITVEKPEILNSSPSWRFKESLELAHLEKQFFAYPYTPYTEKTKDISIFSAINIYSEIEWAARSIIALCRDKALRYRDIALVTGNLGGYEKLIKVIFDQYNIPCFIDIKKDIMNHPLISLISAMFEIFSNNWSYEAVFRYLKTGLVGVNQDDLDVLENYVLACGIRGNKWTADEDWNYRYGYGLYDKDPDQYELDMLERVNRVRRVVVNPLKVFRSKTSGRKEPEIICRALYDFLCDIGIPQRIEDKVEYFRSAGELNLANEYNQVWNILIEVFDQIVEVMGHEKMTIDRFSALLVAGLGEHSTGLIPPALDQVLVGSIDRSRSHEIKALYILGVNDGIFPSGGGNEGVLNDNDRIRLKEWGVEIAQDTRSLAFEEQYLIYNTLSTSSKYLMISYPIADHEGRTMRPSMVISRLKRIFPNIKEMSNIVEGSTDRESLDLISVPGPTFNEVVLNIRRKREGFDINPLWMDAYGWYKENKEWGERCSKSLSGLSYTNNESNISPEKIRRLYGSTIYSSVSRLEKYASCPFSYYIEYGLKARERRIFALRAPDIGTFMHEAIDRFSRMVESEGIKWRDMDRDWCSERISAIVEKILEGMSGSIFLSSKRYRHLVVRLKRVVTRAVWIISEHIKRSSFEPVGYEKEFGDNKDYPAITIELPEGNKIKLTGRIDRIDAMNTEEETYIRIVDYKSGNKEFKLSDIYYGLQIQLITYLDAVWNNGKKEDVPIKPGGMLYLKIDDPIIRSNGEISEDAIETAIMKKLKMKGLILADVKVVRAMDNNLEGSSIIIPARINKGDILGKSSAATINQFELLKMHTKRLLQSICSEIIKGNVSISPYKKKNITSCTYCSFSSICQFDPSIQDNKYKMLHDKSDDEIWKLIDGSSVERGDY